MSYGAFHTLALPAPDTASTTASASGSISAKESPAENHVHDVDDLDDTITRLQAYQEAGADVVFAPGIRTREQVRAVVDSVDVPVNVLVRAGMPTVAELAGLGVQRISVGGAFAFAAYAALVDAADELQTTGTYRYWESAQRGSQVSRSAFGQRSG